MGNVSSSTIFVEKKKEGGKEAMTLYNSLCSVSLPSLCLYHLNRKHVGFSTTDEEKKIKLIVMGGRRKKNNPVLSFTISALSVTICCVFSSSFLLSCPSLGLLCCPFLPPILFSCFTFPRKVLVQGSCLREGMFAHGACDQYSLKWELHWRWGFFLWKTKPKPTFSHIIDIFWKVWAFVEWTSARI